MYELENRSNIESCILLKIRTLSLFRLDIKFDTFFLTQIKVIVFQTFSNVCQKKGLYPKCCIRNMLNISGKFYFNFHLYIFPI